MGKRPGVGVGVLILNDQKVLFGKRMGTHGNETWSCPGGHLEWNESIEACALREVEEECGLKVKNINFAHLTNDMFTNEEKHNITIFVTAEYNGGDPMVLEPNKMVDWKWFSWDSPPSPLFLSTQNLIKSKYNPFK